MHVGGDLTGSVSTGSGIGHSRTGGLTIDGDLSGTVNVGTFLSRPLVVGGDILSTGQINVGSGLAPQADETAPLVHVVGQMDGLIKIGTSLTAPAGAAGIDIDPIGGLSGACGPMTS